MSERKITFPVVGKQHGETIRRNSETGIEIRSSKLDRGGMEHTVYLPDREQGLVMWEYFGELSNARDEATGWAETMRAIIAADHSDAIDEHAERTIAAVRETDHAEAIEDDLSHARKQFPSVFAMIEDVPEQIDTLFPLIATTDDRRNDESGVEIVAQRFFDGPINGYEVRRPAPHKYGYVVVLHAETLAEAYDEACAQHYAVINGVDVNATEPTPAAEVADANGLDGYDKAQDIRDAIPATARRGEVLTEIGRSMTSLRPADALRHAERARDLAAPVTPAAPVAAPDADNEKVFMFGLLRTATGNPDMISAWAARHGLTSDTWTVEALYAAHEADHAEALADNS